MKNGEMQENLLLIIILIFIIAFAVPFTSNHEVLPKINKGYLDLSSWDFEKDGLVKLNGEWEFYWHELYTPENFAIGEVKQPKYIQLPTTVGNQVIDEQKLSHFGYLTLRLKVNVKDEHEVYGLKTQGILTASNIYVDGNLVNSYGRVGKTENASRSIFSTTTSYFENNDNYIEIIIQASNFQDLSSDIKTIYLGTQDQIIKKSNFLLGIDIFLFGSIIIMALYHFVLYMMRSKDRSTLYFGLFCVIVAWRKLFLGERILVQLFPNMSYEFLSKNAAITYHLAVPCFVMFLKEIFSSISNKVVRISQVIGIGLTILCLVTRSRVYDRVAIPSQIITVLIIIYLMYNIIQAVFNKNRGALIIIFGAAALFLTTVHDFLGYNSLVPSTYTVPYGLFVFILSQSYMIADRFSKSFLQAEKLATENNEMYIQIKKLNEGLEKKVEERTASIKNLLNNADQGFLSFGKDLLIDQQYSLECKKIFEKDIKDKKIVDLICTNEDENKKFLIDVLNDIFHMDEDMREVYISLLPEEIKINNKDINIKYKVIQHINNPEEIKIMAVLSDVTETKRLQHQMKNERSTLKMIVSTVVNYNDFIDHIKDYEQFCKEDMHNIIKEENWHDSLTYIYRKIHTFKGIFSQFEMINIVDKLHSFETELSNTIKRTDKEARKFVKSLQKRNLHNWISKDMEVLHNVLGESYFDKDKICIIKEEKIKHIEKRITEIFDSEQSDKILPLIKSMRYRSIKDIMGSYSGYVLKLAEKLEKTIHFTIHGDDVYVDKEQYKGFFKSLVHVFRNSLDHGIESMDERISKGKRLNGSIKCGIKEIEDYILISIKDDGRGINYDKVKEQAIKRGIIKNKSSFTKEQIIELVFGQGFSTKDKVSNISGRGIGLSQVRSIVNDLEGRVEIETQKDKGTEFNFYIPTEIDRK